MNYYSIFEVDLIREVTYSLDEIIAELDQICSNRTTYGGAISNHNKTYMYNIGEPDYDITLTGSDDQAHRIVFRFKPSLVQKETIQTVISLLKKYNFELVIKQEIIFNPELLTMELISENNQREGLTKYPIQLLEEQKKIFEKFS